MRAYRGLLNLSGLTKKDYKPIRKREKPLNDFDEEYKYITDYLKYGITEKELITFYKYLELNDGSYKATPKEIRKLEKAVYKIFYKESEVKNE